MKILSILFGLGILFCVSPMLGACAIALGFILIPILNN